MNKIIVVGHPMSDYQQMERVLGAWGMASAMPSRRECLLPNEITAKLCDAHGALPVIQPESEDQLQPIVVDPVWSGLALDLMLGNLGQKFWGWADPQSIFLLDYWKGLDPKITFVLVYNTPHLAIIPDEKGLQLPQTIEALYARLRNWCSFNAAMLHFFYRNRERCLLVHAEQVQNATEVELEEVRARIAPLGNDRCTMAVNCDQIEQTSTGSLLAEMGESIPCASVPHSREGALRYHLIDAIISHHPESLQLYEELQVVSNFPLNMRVRSDQAAFDAWLAMEDMLAETRSLFTINKAQFAQIEYLCEQGKKALAVVNENELLIRELHKAQELATCYYLEKQELKVQQNTSLSGTTNGYYGAAARVKSQLSYRLGASMIASSRSLGGWLRMPFALISETRKFRKERKKRHSAKLPPIGKYRDAAEAEKVKQHLSYRLGATLIAGSRSPGGWLSLPLALGRELSEFRRQNRKQR